MFEPILEGKDLRRKHFQPKVLRPRPAARVEDITGALEAWQSDCRKFREAGGLAMEDEQRRLIFVEMLPGDVSTYVMLHMA